MIDSDRRVVFWFESTVLPLRISESLKIYTPIKFRKHYVSWRLDSYEPRLSYLPIFTNNFSHPKPISKFIHSFRVVSIFLCSSSASKSCTIESSNHQWAGGAGGWFDGHASDFGALGTSRWSYQTGRSRSSWVPCRTPPIYIGKPYQNCGKIVEGFFSPCQCYGWRLSDNFGLKPGDLLCNPVKNNFGDIHFLLNLAKRSHEKLWPPPNRDRSMKVWRLQGFPVWWLHII